MLFHLFIVFDRRTCVSFQMTWKAFSWQQMAFWYSAASSLMVTMKALLLPFLNLSSFQSETFLYIELQKMVGQWLIILIERFSYHLEKWFQ